MLQLLKTSEIPAYTDGLLNGTVSLSAYSNGRELFIKCRTQNGCAFELRADNLISFLATAQNEAVYASWKDELADVRS